MNKREKAVVIKIIFVTVTTFILVIVFANIKDIINRSEATHAVSAIGKRILQYRKDNGYLPPQNYVDTIRQNVAGSVRMGKLNYRALYITRDSKPDEILAYTTQNYKSLFVSKGYIVLRLNGQIEWMDTKSFEEELMRRKDLSEVPDFTESKIF